VRFHGISDEPRISISGDEQLDLATVELPITMSKIRAVRRKHQTGFARSTRCHNGIMTLSQHRFNTTHSSLRQPSLKEGHLSLPRDSKALHGLPPLSVMPTGILVRTLMMTYILSSPRIVAFSIPIMNRISHSKSWFLDPDRNPVLHSTVRKLAYDHFCAGESEKEVKNTIDTMKNMGFEGVILGYARETIVDQNPNRIQASETEKVGSALERVVEVWKQGTLRTLSMLGKADFLAVK
jgi:hypothetical protein